MLKKLRQRVIDLKAKGRDMLKALEALEAKDDPSEEDLAAITALSADIKANIEALEEANQAVAQAEDRERIHAVFSAPLDNGEPRAAMGITSSEPDPARTFGFADMAEFAMSVHAACNPNRGEVIVDERLRGAAMMAAPTNYHQEQGAAEGYMVPPEFRDAIWEIALGDDEFNLLNEIDSEPTSRNSVEWVADETTPWGSTGIQARWEGEAAQATADKLVTDGRSVKLHKLLVFALATDELLEDAPRLANRLINKAGQAIRWKANEGIINGTGAGMPQGYMASGALVSVAKESGQAADTINATNVLKMFSRMLGGSIARATWLINSDTIPQLGTMTIGDQPMWFPPSAGLREAPGGFLLGRPVVPTEHAKTLGDKGDIQFIDPKGYFGLNKSGGIKFARSIHLYFDYDIEAFRWQFRMGGQPFLSAPVSPANGSNTKSHFVTLDERA